MNRLWRTLPTHAVDRFAPTGVIELLCDDTLHHKTGRQVNGAGVFRDAVRHLDHLQFTGTNQHPSAPPDFCPPATP